MVLTGMVVGVECEETDKGFRAKWCKWIGHGGKAAKQIAEVAGSGYIMRDAHNRAGNIKSDVEGADLVPFHAGAVRYKNHRRGDRVTFTARQDRSGRWLATSVKAEIEVWGGITESA